MLVRPVLIRGKGDGQCGVEKDRSDGFEGDDLAKSLCAVELMLSGREMSSRRSAVN